MQQNSFRLAHVNFYLRNLEFNQERFSSCLRNLAFDLDQVRAVATTNRYKFRQMARLAVWEKDDVQAIRCLDAHLLLNPYDVDASVELLGLLDRPEYSVQLAREVNFLHWMLMAYPATDETHALWFVSQWERAFKKAMRVAPQRVKALAPPQVSTHANAFDGWFEQFRYVDQATLEPEHKDWMSRYMRSKAGSVSESNMVVSNGKEGSKMDTKKTVPVVPVGKQQFNGALMEEINQSLARWLEAHFKASGARFTIQGKPLDYDEVFGVAGLLSVLYANVQDAKSGKLSGFDWYCCTDLSALCEVAPVLSGDPTDHGSVIALRDAIVQKVDGLLADRADESVPFAVDAMYENFYAKSQNDAITFKNPVRRVTAEAECHRLFDEGEFDAAIELINKVVVIRRHIFGAANIHTIEGQRLLAACLAGKGMGREAEQVLEECALRLMMEYGGNHEHTLQAEFALAKHKAESGSITLAIESFGATLNKAAHALGWEHALVQKLIGELNALRAPGSGNAGTVATLPVCDEKLFEARRAREPEKENGGLLERMSVVVKPKRLPSIDEKVMFEIENIGREQPNFAEVTELILNTLHSQIITRRAAQLPPILLLGAPGVGKTRYMKRIADALALPFIDILMAGSADAFKISGLSRYWSSAGPGAIANAFVEHDVANPVFLLDELDKACRSEQSDPYSVILLLLERESSSRFRDAFLDVPMDVSRASFIATANETSHLPEPLLSRMHCFEVQPLDLSGRRTMIGTVYKELLLQEGMAGLLDFNLPEQTLQTLAANADLGGREIKREVLLAMQRACRAFSPGVQQPVQSVLPQHLQFAEKPKRTIGFY